MTASILSEILKEKRREIEERKNTISLKTLKGEAERAAAPLGFIRALRVKQPHAVIAEIKRASPSKGAIRPDLDPVQTAEQFAQAGAACLSVLTDEKFFGGKLEFLRQIKSRLPNLPLLRKDFLIDPYQIWETKAAGADALLLIVAALSGEEFRGLLAESLESGLDILVEVHTEHELLTAYEILSITENYGSRIMIGVNNRDLGTFQTDLGVSKNLLSELAKLRSARGDEAPLITVSESGIHAGQDLRELAACGATAFLIGESLVRSGEPGENLRKLLEQASSI